MRTTTVTVPNDKSLSYNELKKSEGFSEIVRGISACRGIIAMK